MQVLGRNYICIILLLNLAYSTSQAAIPKIKVRIGKNLKKISVSGIDLQKRNNGSVKSQTYRGRKTLSFNCLPIKKMSKLSKPLLLASFSSPTGLVRWNKTAYQGKLNLLASEKHRGCDLINEISLEKYIETLLPKEMNASWPAEALKAQAVAARSYAFYKIKTQQVSKSKGFKTYYDLENSEKHQVNGSFFDSTKSTVNAARYTEGEVLKLASGEFTAIFFHSKCGGKTLTPDEVWTNKIKGYRSVNCPFCHRYGKKEWKVEISRSKFKNVLNKTLNHFYASKFQCKDSNLMRFVPDNKKRSSLRVYDDDKLTIIKKSRIRSTLGRRLARSNYYQLEEKGDKIILRGKGHGHGVGMCQFGALELAKRGYTYKQILAHYFPEHRIEKIY